MILLLLDRCNPFDVTGHSVPKNQGILDTTQFTVTSQFNLEKQIRVVCQPLPVVLQTMVFDLRLSFLARLSPEATFGL